MSEMERRLLARLASDPVEVMTVWEMGLRSQVFEEPICGSIFNFIIDYWRTERMKLSPPLAVIQAEFPGVELLNDQEISTTYLAQRFMESYATLNLHLDMLEAAKVAATDPRGGVKYLLSKMYEVNESVTPRHSRSNMAENVDDRRRRYLERTEGTGMGVTLGVPELDAHVNGLYPGELCVLGAYSKIGKTMYLAKVAVAARRAGLTPIIFSLEMPKEEIEDRLDAMFSMVSYDRLLHSRLTIEEARILRTAQDELTRMGPIHIEQPEEGDRTVGAMVNRARYVGANYVIIDQLSFMEPGRKVRDLKEHHSVIMKQLKTEIGKGSVGRLPCLLAVQLNRQSQSRTDGIGLDSFANATEVEATCDMALGLWRNAEMAANNTMKMEILGCRRSSTVAWQLHWHLRNKTEISVERKLDD